MPSKNIFQMKAEIFFPDREAERIDDQQILTTNNVEGNPQAEEAIKQKHPHAKNDTSVYQGCQKIMYTF